MPDIYFNIFNDKYRDKNWRAKEIGNKNNGVNLLIISLDRLVSSVVFNAHLNPADKSAFST